jgi:hypothetical protein
MVAVLAGDRLDWHTMNEPKQPSFGNSNPPDGGKSSVFYFRIGAKRYEIRSTVQVRQVVKGPAEIIEMSKPDPLKNRAPEREAPSE